ncbi:MAG: DUF1190 domain-containing protein [Alphaproteobacteria bacterium]
MKWVEWRCVAVVVSALLVFGCQIGSDSSTADANARVFKGLAECIAAEGYDEARCQDEWTSMNANGLKHAPKYLNEARCHAAHSNSCKPQDKRMAALGLPSGAYYPGQVGWISALPGRPTSYPQPVYRSEDAGRLELSSGFDFPEEAKRIRVPADQLGKPKNIRVIFTQEDLRRS